MYGHIWMPEGGLMLPKNKELERCINELLESKEEERLLAEQARSILKEEISRGAMWKAVWRKRAKKLAAYKRLAEIRESRRALLVE